MMIKRGAALFFTLCLLGAQSAAGPRDAGKSNAPPAATSGGATAAPTLAATTLPSPYKLNLLIRTTLIALNQANATGNYSVLRDLSAPGFQKANNPARLAEIFSEIRGRNLDLSAILFFEPKLVRQPVIQPNGHLRLSGYFETRPEQVSFDLAFERGVNDWLLFGIAVEVAAPKGATGVAGDASSAQRKESAKSDNGSSKVKGEPGPSKTAEEKPRSWVPVEPALSKTTK